MKKGFLVAIILIAVLTCALAFAACAEVSTTVTYMVDGEVFKNIVVTGTGQSDPGFTPSKSGYTFDGWYTDEALYTPFDFEAYAANEERGNLVVYAKFTLIETPDDPETPDEPQGEMYTVTFYVDGDASVFEPREFESGKAMGELPAPEKNGYRFVTWKDVFGEEYNSRTIMPDNDLTLYASWQKVATTYEDDYVSFKPASEGKKHDSDYYVGYSGVQEYLFVELTSDDIGGEGAVGDSDNFDLTQNMEMEFSVKEGYTLLWYEGSWNNPNGAQMFTLDYGSNIQLLTVSEGQRVVKRYLVDIYVLHDYYVSLYEDIYDDEPYTRVRVIENEFFPVQTDVREHADFEYKERVYYNSSEREYLPYVYSEPVTKNISLYQTYEPKEIELILDEEGEVTETAQLTPYSEHSELSVPEKEGYDFIGWQAGSEEDAYYFADITGNSQKNYLNAEENFDSLTAVFAPKKFYQYIDEERNLHVEPLIPVVFYTDNSQREISDIGYALEGETVAVPTSLPAINRGEVGEKVFSGWNYYRESNSSMYSDDFVFSTHEIDSPTAVYAGMTSAASSDPSRLWYGISLGDARTFSSDMTVIGATFRMYLPVEATYTLKVRGNVDFTVSAYMDQNAASYSANGGEAEVPLYWDWGDSTGSGGGWVSFSVTERSGSMTVTLSGPSGINLSEYVVLDEENTIVYGQPATLNDPQNKVGYDHIFLDENGNRVSQDIDEWTYESGQVFDITDEFIALERTITFDSCGGSNVDAITETTDTAIQLPVPEKEGYVFLGWFYEKIPAAISEKAEIEVMPGVDTTLYAAWADEQDAQYLTYTVNEDEITVTGYTSDGTSVKLPSEIFGLPVTHITDKMFYENAGIASVTIPESVTYIGDYAFYDCNALTIYCEVSSEPSGWSSSWNSSDRPVVWDCNNNDLADDGNIYYVDDNGIRYIINDDAATVVRQGAALSGEIIIPEQITYKDVVYAVTTINESAFSGCSSITSITIPDSVTSIERGAFSGCSGLESITIPFVGGSMKTASDTYQYPFGYIFGTSSYEGGVSTRQYYYGSSTSRTTYSNYYIPSSLKSVTVTGGNILYGAFYDCGSLTSITIGGGVTSIGDYAFRGCSSLTGVTIGDGVTSIGDYAFRGCSSLTSIVIPESVTSIGNNAFISCSSLTSITIPESVTSIGSGAFSGCSGLESITIPFVGGSMKTESDTYQYPFGYIFGTSSYEGGVSTRQCYYGSSTSSSASSTYYIPLSLKSVTVTGGNILYGAFYNCSSLTSITIPESVTSIGSSAFYNCSSLTSIVIPESVTSIGDDAFYGCDSLTSITIPESVTSIGSSAFEDCDSLESITIGGSVASIGDSAFDGCSSFKKVYISDIAAWCAIDFGNTSANPLSNGAAFYLNGELVTSLDIPDSVTSIGDYAFYNCDSLTSIVIPDSVTSIGDSVFYNCDSLKEVHISDIATWCAIDFGSNSANPLYYGAALYLNGELVTSLEMPDSVTSISDYAFRNYNLLESVTIGNYVTSIGDSAFSGCSSLTSIVIPDSVTSIGNYAFEGCDSLTSIVIPDSVTSIGSGTFSDCSGLESMTIPFVGSGGSSNTSFGYIFGPQYSSDNSRYVPSSLKEVVITGGTIIGNSAFYYCSSLTSITIPDSVTSIGRSAFYYCSSLTSITIGDSVTSIGEYAFNGCDSLTSITIPDSVTSIGGRVFDDCNALTIYCEASSEPSGWSSSYWNSNGCPVVWDCNNNNVAADGAIYYIYNEIRYSLKNGQATVAGQPTSLSGEVVLPESVTYDGNIYSVTSIDSYAFSDCSSLTSITIPDGVTSIGSYAFYTCRSLTSIVIPDGVTSISYSAFEGCSSLTSITIPDGVTGIGSDAFSGCRSLTSIVIPDSVTSIGSDAFSGCRSLTSIVIPDSVTSIGSGAFSDCSGLESMTIPFVGSGGSSNTPFGYIFGAQYSSDNSRYVPSSLKEVVITGGTSIGNSAFNGCDSLTSIIIPDGVTSIDMFAFGGCSSLTSIVIPDSVTSIGYYAFSGCTNLFQQENGVSYVDKWIVDCNDSLTQVQLRDNTVGIADSAFESCSSLASITIPDSVSSIGDDAFRWCSSLASIVVEEGNAVYHSERNCLIETESKTLIAGCKNSVIPSDGSVTNIGDSAFFGCYSLTSIVIPDGVTSIGDHAFDECRSLTSIVIPDSVTSIGWEAFKFCYLLTSITFQGRMAQWKAIDKGLSWDEDAGSYKVTCTDGVLDKNGNKV